MKLMKACNKTTQILTIAAALAAVVMFFFTFATVVTNGQAIELKGSVMSFKGTVELGELTFKMARSADVMLCMILSILGTVFAALTFKYKGMRYASPVATLISGIYMLVIALAKPVYYVDVRPLTNVSSITYSIWPLIIAITLLVAAVVGIAHLLIDDYIIVKQSKEGKRTIWQRIVHFFKDYKSEVKKITWPRWNFVIKNTVVVLVICLIIGAFIWLLDFGLAQLVKALFS